MNIIRDYPVDLRKYLPEFVHISEEEMQQLLAVESKEHQVFIEVIKDALDQLFIDSATWGLKRWERLIDLKPDSNDTYEQRRNRILLYLQPKKTSTKKAMEELTLRYMDEGSIAKLIEYNEEYRFKIVLDGYVNYFNDLRNAINIYKPAHLAFWFEQLITDLKDEIIQPTENFQFDLSLQYEDVFPYGLNYPLLRGKNLERGDFTKREGKLRGEIERGKLFAPIRKPFEDLNIDEVKFDLLLDLADDLIFYFDRNETLQRGDDFKRGAFQTAADLRLSTAININFEDDISVDDNITYNITYTPLRGQLIRNNFQRGEKAFDSNVEIIKPPKRNKILSRGNDLIRQSEVIIC